MRQRARNGDLSVHAIAGTYVVILGMDITPGSPVLDDLLGFAISRRNEKTGRERWISTFKGFPPAPGQPAPAAGQLVSSREHPVQGFLWGDYTTASTNDYTYRVVPLYGRPAALQEGQSVSVRVSTENEVGGKHAIFFNRGAAASQGYERKFGDQTPDQAGTEAYRWLSRGLEEALLAFIAQAGDASWGIRGAVYEFSYPPVLQALKAAADRGADVRIIYDCKTGAKKPGARNQAAVRTAGIDGYCIERKSNNSFIAHNKFLVLLKDNVPVQLWTGSTNITEGGVFGHSNVGHAVRDRRVAQTYLDYWNELRSDPEAKELRAWCDRHTPLPTDLTQPGITPVFSPRGSTKALELYRDAMDAARQSVFLTAAFGVNQLFREVLAVDKPYLRYLLLERVDEPDPEKPEIEVYQRDRENLVAVGSYLAETVLERWIEHKFEEEQLSGLNSHVKYIHTKYMLVDPLSDAPTVITGSANFSDASTRRNDENMLIIHGDTRVADIYLGEFMRLFSHYRFRGIAKQQTVAGATPQRLYLATDNSWVARYYQPGTTKNLERRLFA